MTDEALGHGAAQTSAGYRLAVIDILGGLAYAELSAFSQLAHQASSAPTHAQMADVARLAVGEFAHYQCIEERLETLGVDVDDAMEPFVQVFDEFHRRTEPQDFLEGLVKTYVGDGIAQDFHREIAAYLDPQMREFVLQVLTPDVARREFIVGTVRAAIDQEERLTGRLALWARRLMGETLTQAQRVSVERDALASLLVGGEFGSGADLAELGRMFARITDKHTRRMERLGLSS